MSEARRLVDLAVRSSVNGVVITDATLPDNPIVYVNPAFELMTGFSAVEAVGRNSRFLQSPDTDQPALDGLRTAIRRSFASVCSTRRSLHNGPGPFRVCGAYYGYE